MFYFITESLPILDVTPSTNFSSRSIIQYAMLETRCSYDTRYTGHLLVHVLPDAEPRHTGGHQKDSLCMVRKVPVMAVVAAG